LFRANGELVLIAFGEQIDGLLGCVGIGMQDEVGAGSLE